MPTNEAGLSEGHDLGDGGHSDASDMPGGENNDGPNESKGGGQAAGVGQAAQSPGQVSPEGADEA